MAKDINYTCTLPVHIHKSKGKENYTRSLYLPKFMNSIIPKEAILVEVEIKKALTLTVSKRGKKKTSRKSSK